MQITTPYPFSSVAQSCPTLCDPMDGSMPGLPVHHQLPELTQTHVHWVGDAIQLSHPLSSPSPPAFNLFPSIRIFSNESVLRSRWPKYWSFSFNISPSKEYSGLTSLRMDWFDLLAVQGALKSLLQHHSSKASILWRSAFFIVQLSNGHNLEHWQHQILKKMWGNRNSIHCWWKYKMAQPFWKTVWQFLTKLSIFLPCNLAIMLFGIYPKELKTYFHTETCPWRFVVIV